MSKLNAGVISFDRYEVNEVRFKLNPNYVDEEVNISINLESNFQVEDSGNLLVAQLFLTVFPEAERMGFPFEMYLALTGYFTKSREAEDIKTFEANAMAILFPYVRAIVSTYTASANVTPLILPTINTSKFLNNSRTKKI